MKDKKNSRNVLNKEQITDIPDLDIIDLENNDHTETSAFQSPAEEASDKKKKGGRSRINIHIILLVMVLIFIVGIIYKVKTWGVFIDPEEIFKDGPGTYNDSFDNIMPLTNAEGKPVHMDYNSGASILVFGNAPFADDRNTETNLANMIQEMSGATVYNCSVSDSYLAALAPTLRPEGTPMDIFNFYWLFVLAMGDELNDSYLRGVETLGENAPPEAMEVYNTLKSIDLNTVDVIAIMYDASDYLAGHPIFNPENDTDITYFTGNLEAGLDLIQNNYPNIRIIVLSPAYAYGIDENGKYVSSDIQSYFDILSNYVIMECVSCVSRSITFVDNLYGTINEDDADKYLTDHLHLNVKGREKIAERFIYALNYFQDSGTVSPDSESK